MANEAGSWIPNNPRILAMNKTTVSSNRQAAKSYAAWIADLKKRWRATQIKAAVAVNSSLIEFYWNLGRDIAERYSDSKLGNEFYRQMSLDLKDGNPEAKGLSPQTLKYCGYFYRLYASSEGGQQVVDLSVPKSSGCRWESPTTRSSASCRRPRSSPSATPTPRLSLPVPASRLRSLVRPRRRRPFRDARRDRRGPRLTMRRLPARSRDAPQGRGPALSD